MAVYGYIRVSTNKGQTTENQRKEILDAGYNVSEWYSEEGVSGKLDQFQRPMFKTMYDKAVKGDICIVTKMDRLGRTARDTLNTIEAFKQKGVKVIVLQLGSTDMTSSAGKLLVTLLAAVAEMERDLCVERIQSGLARTKEAGTKLGRPMKIAPQVFESLVADRNDGMTLDALSAKHNVPRSVLHVNLSKWGGDVVNYRKEWETRQAQYKAAEGKRVEKAMRLSSLSM